MIFINMKKLKGFTLVESIVVMLILAILMGMFIPNMLGYIKRTDETAAIMECRSTVIASQTILNQTYAYKTADFEGVYKNNTYNITASSYNTQKAGIINLSGYSGMTDDLNGVICGLAEADGEVLTITADSDCRLQELTYVSAGGVKVEYNVAWDEGYVVVK